MEAILTIGIPGSGKTTFANELVERGRKEGREWSNINRDDIRMEHFELEHYHDYKFSKENEKKVTEMHRQKISEAAAKQQDIIISNTNLNPDHRESLEAYLKGLGYHVTHVCFDVTYEEAVERDRRRKDKTVGPQVIWDFYQRMLEYKEEKKYVPNDSIGLPEAYIFDIDGTIATMYDRNGKRMRSPYDLGMVEIDRTIPSVTRILGTLHRAGYKIVLLSGRDGSAREKTEYWLAKHGIPYDDLFMRPTGNNEKDFRIKKEIFFNDVAPKYRVMGVFDDRPSVCRMWHNIGVTLFKVGDPVKEF